MKLKLFSLIVICLFMCLILTGCGETNDNLAISDSNPTSPNDTTEQQDTSNISDNEKKMRKMADTWMSMAKNVDLRWRREVKNSNEYAITDEYKRGNNGMLYWVEELNEKGKLITPENDGLGNEYYYYHFLGDYKWKSYVYFSDGTWDRWYFNGNYPASPQIYCMGRPWNILDKYSNEHETIKIEGVGEVDTVKGVDDEGYTYYYSKKLNMNVKIENNVQTWCLTKFDTKVSSSFPRALPNMDAVDAKSAESNGKIKFGD
ncbi:MAG: hypothetical protein IKP28_02060 [Clostridia bacterium]|nr:hypothetical protein [Clostridia bacterium]